MISTLDLIEVLGQYRKASIQERELMREEASARFRELKDMQSANWPFDPDKDQVITEALMAIKKFQWAVGLDDDLQIDYIVALIEQEQQIEN